MNTTKAGQSNMKTSQVYLHLAGTVFPEEATALERRLVGETEHLWRSREVERDA
jgi:hypothetical protein